MTDILVLFAGFTQKTVDNIGVTRLSVLASGLDHVEAFPLQWDSDVNQVAGWVARLVAQNPVVRLHVFGYSYGATTAARFCKVMAKKHGVKTWSFFNCDGVKYHAAWMPPWLRWTTGWIPGGIRLAVPVAHVARWFQRLNKPDGDKFTTVDGVLTGTQLGVTHDKIDDHEFVHTHVLAQLKRAALLGDQS